jgi:5-methylcytosine-specific restriction endonuclease McrA
MSDNFYKTEAWKKARVECLRLHNWSCKVCGKSLRGFKKSRVDHKIPYKKRPDLGLVQSNLQALCPSCDNKKHAEKGRGYEVEPVGEDGFPPSWS